MKLIKKCCILSSWSSCSGGRGVGLVGNSKDRLRGRNQEDMWPGRYSRYTLPQLSEFLNDITEPVLITLHTLPVTQGRQLVGSWRRHNWDSGMVFYQIGILRVVH